MFVRIRFERVERGPRLSPVHRACTPGAEMTDLGLLEKRPRKEGIGEQEKADCSPALDVCAQLSLLTGHPAPHSGALYSRIWHFYGIDSCET